METTPIKSKDLPPGVSPVSKTGDPAAKLLDKIGGFGAYLHKTGVRPGVGNVLFSLKGLLDVGKLAPGKTDRLDAPHVNTPVRADDTQQQASAPKNDATYDHASHTHHPDDTPHDDRRRRENSSHRDDTPTSKATSRNDAQDHTPTATAKSHDDAPDVKRAAGKDKNRDDNAPAAAIAAATPDTAKPPAASVVEVAALTTQAARRNVRDTPTPRNDDGLAAPLKKDLGGKAQNIPHPAANTAQEEAAKAAAAAGKVTPAGRGKQTHELGSSHGAQQTQGAPAAKLDSEASARQLQAQALARTLGDDARMKVHVNVKDDATTLKSQTSASLAPQAALASARGQSQSAKPSNGHGATQTKALHLAQAPVVQPQGAAQIGAVQAAFDTALKAANGGGAATTALNASGAAATMGAMSGGESAQAASLGSPMGLQTPTQQSAAIHKSAPPPPTPSHKPVAEQVSVQITKALADGLDKIRIQLRPASMGRVDVQIELSRDGHVSAVISADNKHTLDMLKQDSRELQKALQDAGLQAGTGDLTFNLNENGAQGGGGPEHQPPRLRAMKEPSLEDLLSAGPDHTDVVTKDRVDIRA
ncbi:flagellar hook-length control protein FliK [Varunaivibrio sulfuroxidans]|uniref:Flagellar hook-length control protein FliK n=1 Tax=Varunaivibrio sulfuroxidans TaxID=1773489 RepID=A0A4V2UNI8_9PROT|nr:flagellar hook-length control protein FliK [Varunaivibrio sulfuroxidans]TCS62141.1 flagellar hook-length control protein FliK [Varunaivibrio sulfuroxidans]WES30572.1 flagellar hook-length control protein FliK [Varunaivibrio sulfuroxidans]